MAEEAESGTGAVVGEQFGGGGEVCLHTLRPPAGMITLGPIFPSSLRR